MATYEVRVAGELGEPLLRYLRWSHYAVPEQTLVRLTAARPSCTGSCGRAPTAASSIERVRRVRPPRTRRWHAALSERN